MLVAFCIISSFAVVGKYAMRDVFHITIAEFTFGGGLLLVVIGIYNIMAKSRQPAQTLDTRDPPPDGAADDPPYRFEPLGGPLLGIAPDQLHPIQRHHPDAHNHRFLHTALPNRPYLGLILVPSTMASSG
jgi:hypothetical protein